MLGALFGPMFGSIAPMLAAGLPFSLGMMGTTNPWSSLIAPSVFTTSNPWANLWAPAWPVKAAFTAPPNLWGSNPWVAMMQTLQPSPPTLTDYFVSSFRTASSHATAAILAQMQQPAQDLTKPWTWPMDNTGRVH